MTAKQQATATEEIAGTPLFIALYRAFNNRGASACVYSVNHFETSTTLAWTLTYQRCTAVDAFNQNEVEIQEANAKMLALAEKYRSLLVKMELVTEQTAVDIDAKAEAHGVSSYAEQPNSFGSKLVFRDDGHALWSRPETAPLPTLGPKNPPFVKTSLVKTAQTPYADSLIGITPDFRCNPVLPEFLERLHQAFPFVRWQYRTLPGESTSLMVCAAVSYDVCVEIVNNVKLRFRRSTYTGEGSCASQSGWWYEHEVGDVTTLWEDGDYKYSVVLFTSTPDAHGIVTLGLRPLAFSKERNMNTQAIARLQAVMAGAALEAKKKAVRASLRKALLNVKRTTKASKGGITKLSSVTKAYYGKLYSLYQKTNDCQSATELSNIIKAVKEARAKRSEAVKAVRAKKVKL